MLGAISLDNYRSKRKRLYLAQYRLLIDEFIQFFIHQNFRANFENLGDSYFAVKSLQSETSWDYYDFRECLKDAIHEVFGRQLWTEVQKQRWFDSKFLSQDELIERCLSLFVLGPAASGAS